MMTAKNISLWSELSSMLLTVGWPTLVVGVCCVCVILYLRSPRPPSSYLGRSADVTPQHHSNGTPCPCARRIEAARELLQRRMAQWQSHLPSDPNAPGTRRVRTHSPAGFEGETDYNSEVAIYREGIALMAEVSALLDAKETTHG